MRRLDATGLYYYNARYYDATIGRFISADKLVSHPANPQSFNRYSYCINNPLKYIDPSGLTDVTVTNVPLDLNSYMLACEGLAAFTVTDENGNSTIIITKLGDTVGLYDQTRKWANVIRQNDGDNDINIFMRGDPKTKDDDRLRRYIYNDSWSHDDSVKWADYVLSPINFTFENELNCEIWDMLENGTGTYPAISHAGIIFVILFPTMFVSWPALEAASWVWAIWVAKMASGGFSFYSVLTCDGDDPDIPYRKRIPY
jgi:RHS repeat-associated protein